MNINLKKYQSTLIIFSVLLIPFGAQSGEVTSTFSPGGTLTSTQMNEIKDAVNDNDVRSIANEGDVFSNTAAIGNLFGGDGSAGDLTVSASVDWNSAPPANPMFDNITIDAGQTLTVPAGTTIRCSGNFTNNGSIIVSRVENNGNYIGFISPTETVNQFQGPGAGDTPLAAGIPALTDTTSTFVNGSNGGRGISRAFASTSFNQLRIGGGGSSGNRFNFGGFGGGLIKIYCTGNIVNNGTISAVGFANLSGGTGGGIVILGSTTQIINDAAASIIADGTDGNASTAFNAANGGGGGGIIVLVAPSITNDGVTSVLGGAPGDTTTNVTQANHSGGSGGGASGGNGGNGGDATSSNTSGAASAGQDGHLIEITSNPAYMM